MPTAFIIHGIYGSPEENWFPWLKKELEGIGCEVITPHLPSKESLKPEDWSKAFSPYEEKLQEDSLVIGHSLGAAFLLKVLEKHSVHAAFFIAAAWGKTNNEFDSVMRAIADQSFDWKRIKENCSVFKIYHADNDPYLNIERAETLAKNLDASVTLVRGAGHFNEKSGYVSFPLLLEDIKTTLSATSEGR